MSEWISVEDRKPDSNVEVLAFIDFGDRAWFEVLTFDRFTIMNGVTHWMPLPQPPKEVAA